MLVCEKSNVQPELVQVAVPVSAVIIASIISSTSTQGLEIASVVPLATVVAFQVMSLIAGM